MNDEKNSGLTADYDFHVGAICARDIGVHCGGRQSKSEKLDCKQTATVTSADPWGVGKSIETTRCCLNFADGLEAFEEERETDTWSFRKKSMSILTLLPGVCPELS